MYKERGWIDSMRQERLESVVELLQAGTVEVEHGWKTGNGYVLQCRYAHNYSFTLTEEDVQYAEQEGEHGADACLHRNLDRIHARLEQGLPPAPPTVQERKELAEQQVFTVEADWLNNPRYN